MRALLDIGLLSLTVLAMTVVGMETEVSQFRSLFRLRRHLFTMLLSQALVLPVIALVLVRVLAVSSHVGAGLLLVAACPVGNIANFYALLARANLALCVVLNTLSCMVSFATMLLIFGVYSRLLGAEFGFEMPALKSFLWLILLVALPVLTGMWWRRIQPDFVGRHLKVLANICLGGLGFILLCVIVSQRELLATEWRETVLSAALFMLLAALGGLGLSSLLGLVAADRFTVTATFAVRNVGLATAIAVTWLNRVDYAAFATVYFVTEVPLLLGFTAVYRRWVDSGRLVLQGQQAK